MQPGMTLEPIKKNIVMSLRRVYDGLRYKDGVRTLPCSSLTTLIRIPLVESLFLNANSSPRRDQQALMPDANTTLDVPALNPWILEHAPQHAPFLKEPPSSPPFLSSSSSSDEDESINLALKYLSIVLS